MLELDDPRWSSLKHAYGPASDTPDLLRLLSASPQPKAGYKSEPWFTLWSSLCHQGDVYEASYAALPHVVDIACSSVGPLDFGFFQLPAAIEIARCNGKGPRLPDYLAEVYFLGVARLMESVAIHRNDPWDSDMLLSAICAQAVAKGHIRQAEAIMNLDDALIDKLINLDFDD